MAGRKLMDAVLPRKLRVEPPAWIERLAAWVKNDINATFGNACELIIWLRGIR